MWIFRVRDRAHRRARRNLAELEDVLAKARSSKWLRTGSSMSNAAVEHVSLWGSVADLEGEFAALRARDATVHRTCNAKLAEAVRLLNELRNLENEGTAVPILRGHVVAIRRVLDAVRSALLDLDQTTRRFVDEVVGSDPGSIDPQRAASLMATLNTGDRLLMGYVDKAVVAAEKAQHALAEDHPRPQRGACPECARAARGGLTLRCPGCEHQMNDYNEASLVRRIASAGSWTAPCDRCGHETFVFGSESVCKRCHRLRADVNEYLAQRFAALHGRPPREGFCPGCQEIGKAAPITLAITCPYCARESWVAEDQISQTHGAVMSCSGCSRSVRIPATVWCPDCGLNIRRHVNRLITEANQR